MELGSRLGTFFLLVGAALLILYGGSVISHDNSTFIYLPAGLLCLLTGFLLRRRGAKPAGESGRFRVVKNIRERSRKRNEEKDRKK